MNEYRKEDGTEQKEKAAGAETEVNAPVGGESSGQAECEAQRTSKEAEEVSENQPEEQKSSEELAAEAAAMAAVAEESDKSAPETGRAKPKQDAKDEKIEELTDRLKRNLAEFDNFRKRTEKEKTAMFDLGAKNVLEKLLPVIDNFERSLESAPDAPELKPYADGMEMIYRQLLKNLEEAGAKPMDAKGKPFDPALHNAVMHVEDESLEENVVVEEFQKGYYYKDGVLRHSMVKVAN